MCVSLGPCAADFPLSTGPTPPHRRLGHHQNHGLTKITGYAATLDYMVLHNIPLPDILLPLTIIIQIGGGLVLMAGFRIREMALCLAGLTILINVGMHDFWNTYPELNTQHEVQNFVKNLGIFAGLLVLSGAARLPQFGLSQRH